MRIVQTKKANSQIGYGAIYLYRLSLFSIFFAIVVPAQATLFPCDASQRGFTQECTVTYNGVTQIIRLHIPSNYSPGNAMVFNYSGVPCGPETAPPDPSGQTCAESAENTS